MELIAQQMDLGPVVSSRKRDFAEYVREQQYVFSGLLPDDDLTTTALDIYPGLLRDNEEQVNAHLKTPNALIATHTEGRFTDLDGLAGDHAALTANIVPAEDKYMVPVSWYHDALLHIDRLNATDMVQYRAFGTTSLDFLLNSDNQALQGLEMLKYCIRNPNYAQMAVKHFYHAKKILDQHNVPAPYLYYCTGLILTYFTFNFSEAALLFEQAIFNLKHKKGTRRLIAACTYELAKLQFLEGRDDMSIILFREAAVNDPGFWETRFQLLRALDASGGGGSEMEVLLDELAGYSRFYFIKIITDKALFRNDTVIGWLCVKRRAVEDNLTSRLQEVKTTHKRILSSGFFADRMEAIEQVLHKGQHFPMVAAIETLAALDQDMQQWMTAYRKSVDELIRRRAYYADHLHGDDPSLRELTQFVASLTDTFETGTLTAPEDMHFDFSALSAAMTERARNIEEYEKRYNVRLYGDGGKDLRRKAFYVKRGQLLSNVRKAFGTAFDPDEGHQFNMSALIALVLSGVVYFRRYSLVEFLTERFNNNVSDWDFIPESFLGCLLLFAILFIGLFTGFGIFYGLCIIFFNLLHIAFLHLYFVFDRALEKRPGGK